METNDQKPNVKIEQGRGSLLNFFRRLFDDSTIIGSINKNVVVPKLIDTAYDASIAAAKKVFYGEDTKWSRGSSNQTKTGAIVINGHTQYNAISQSSAIRNDTPSRVETKLANAISNSAPIRKGNVYTVRIRNGAGVDAWKQSEQIIDILLEKCRQSDGLASVQDLFLACGQTNIPSTSVNYGWIDKTLLKPGSINRHWDLNDDDCVVIELPAPIDISKM